MQRKQDVGSLIRIDNKLFDVTNERVDDSEVKSYLGSITDITEDKTYEKPSENFQSNELEVGTEIYAVDYPYDLQVYIGYNLMKYHRYRIAKKYKA